MIVPPEQILQFWFQPEGAELGHRKAWFAKDPAFDATVRELFLDTHEAAIAGELAEWETGAGGALALVLLLDQFSRHMFRGTAAAFASDAAARAASERALYHAFDQALPPVRRMFFYLPLEHSEALADQERAVALFTALARAHPGFDGMLDYACRHRSIIARFGRFPHRNALLGRPGTADEDAFLLRPGSGF